MVKIPWEKYEFYTFNPVTIINLLPLGFVDCQREARRTQDSSYLNVKGNLVGIIEMRGINTSFALYFCQLLVCFSDFS